MRGVRSVAARVGVLTLVLVGCATDAPNASAGATAIAVTNVAIIDGRGADPVRDGVVVIQEDRITAVGPAATVTVPGDAEVIDGRGGTVMPGLADMHVHMVGGWDGESTDLLGYRRYLNALLYSGVTTVFDVGNVLPYLQQIRAEVAEGRLAGPRIYMVGALVDGPEPIWPPLSYSARDEGSIRAYVEQLAGAGVDALKGYAGLSEAMVDSLVLIGAEHSLPVVVDLGFGGSYSAAVESGVKALAHARTGPWSDDEIATMVAQGTASITTLAVLESFSRRRLQDLSFLDHPLIASTSPPRFLEELRAFSERELSEGEQDRAEQIGGALASAMENTLRMHEAGVLIVAGTDAPYPGVFQGEGVHRELELLVEAGLTPLQAIRAATHNAAVLVGAEDQWGSIAPGMIADLILVRGNPAETIEATRDITHVVKRGRVLDREALTFDESEDPGFQTVGSVHSN